MRERRYRAWDGKEMAYSKNMPDIGFWKFVAYDSTTKVMDWTGLKDKNNIDVYEGDITVDGVIEFNQDVCGYIIRRSNNTFIRLETRRKTLEITGNIYEHPQLIDNQKQNLKQ